MLRELFEVRSLIGLLGYKVSDIIWPTIYKENCQSGVRYVYLIGVDIKLCGGKLFFGQIFLVQNGNDANFSGAKW